ncbi:MAG: 3-phosphoshikimate 1-carboxyvinyltransferase, partial [Planctomycetota bacterium]|nr:3-phosphoshikimate 1-carboxyvinyltransferase [Planctomycetota bacterium]
MTAREVAPLAFPSDVELLLPGSKSEANRLLVLAALSGRQVRLVGVTPSDDVRHLIAGLAALGFCAELDDQAETAQVGPRRPDPPRSGALYCGNAGTATRFLMSVAAITPGVWDIHADERMRSRPMRPLAEAWRA